MSCLIDFSCAYVDYRSVSKTTIAQHFNERSGGFKKEDNSVVLSTCHRIEEYSDITTAYHRENFGSLASNIKFLTGSEGVLERLSRIVSGADSWILGEQYIAQQVLNAFRKTSNNSPLSWLGNKAVEIGLKAKADSGLIANIDYPDIALNVVDKILQGKVRSILVVGGGMLGRSVAEKAQSNGWNDVYIVSRNPKKMRKMGYQNALKLSQVAPITGEGLAVIIATMDVTPTYRTEIETFLERKKCGAIIDLSAAPQLSRSKNYVHMYDQIFTDEVLSANRIIAPKIPDTIRLISDMVKIQMHNAL